MCQDRRWQSARSKCQENTRLPSVFSKWLLHQRYSFPPSHQPPHQSSQPGLLSPHFLSLSAKSGWHVTSNMKRPQFPFNVACLERQGPAGRDAREEHICTTSPTPSSQVAPLPLKCERWGRGQAPVESQRGRREEQMREEVEDSKHLDRRRRCPSLLPLISVFPVQS